MAKVTIILEDTDEGTVAAEVEFDPPRKTSLEDTPAQRDAFTMLSAAFTMDDLTSIE